MYISNTDVAQTPHFGTAHILESTAGHYARHEAREEGEKKQEATVNTQCDVETCPDGHKKIKIKHHHHVTVLNCSCQSRNSFPIPMWGKLQVLCGAS